MLYSRYDKEKNMKKALLWGVVICAMLIFLGCRDDPDDEDDDFPGLTLTVPDITGVEITAGSIMAVSAPTDPVAVGFNVSGTFEFYNVGPDKRMPDWDKPFTALGTYLIGLAVVDMTVSPPKETEVYMYVVNGTNQPQPYPFAKLTGNTIPWSQFQLTYTTSGLTLTVKDITEGVTIVAASLFSEFTPPSSPTPVAFAPNMNGNFSFISVEAQRKAFTTTGDYYILLATSIDGTGTNYIYIGNGSPPPMPPPPKYTFANLTGSAIDFSEFTPYPPPGP